MNQLDINLARSCCILATEFHLRRTKLTAEQPYNFFGMSSSHGL